MMRTNGWLAGLVAVAFAGCAGPERQVSDLSAPAAPRLSWSPSKKSEIPAKPLLAQDLVIREHRFLSHSPELNSDGEDQLQRLASNLKSSSAKITIESSGETPILPVTMPGNRDNSVKLDLQRRQYVVQKLLTLGIPDAESRVVVSNTTPVQ